MPIEQRVISPKTKPGSGKAGDTPVETGGDAAQGKGKARKFALALAMVLVGALIAAGAYVFFLKPKPPVVEEPPQPGAVVEVDHLSINLAGGHYLRMGFSLQMTEEAGEGINVSRAQDAAIALFSGRSIAEVTSPEGRQALKTQLTADLAGIYDGTVMDVYLTDYVTQ